MVEYLTGPPFIDDLVEAGWKLDSEGMLPVPEGAGLGVSINMDAVEKHTGERFGSARRSV
jgi:L-alanine-DL-glutamate epimerase-like enolase superfamily enzyme